MLQIKLAILKSLYAQETDNMDNEVITEDSGNDVV
jgi:hypothetical protein